MYEEGYRPIPFKDEQTGLWGHINVNGNIVVGCQWKDVYLFTEGLGAVKDEHGKWGFVDESGEIIIPCQWEAVDVFCEGLACVQAENGKWGFIDKSGNVVLPCKWRDVTGFHNGRAEVKKWLFDFWHYIDRNGNSIKGKEKKRDIFIEN